MTLIANQKDIDAVDLCLLDIFSDCLTAFERFDSDAGVDEGIALSTRVSQKIRNLVMADIFPDGLDPDVYDGRRRFLSELHDLQVDLIKKVNIIHGNIGHEIISIHREGKRVDSYREVEDITDLNESGQM